jgi:hypothetical protein
MTTASVCPLYVPQPYQDAVDSGRLVLRGPSSSGLRALSFARMRKEGWQKCKRANAKVMFGNKIAISSLRKRGIIFAVKDKNGS